ncbi:hypothetical protein [Hymenobacter fodinae]|uniref:DUF2268 domain-containing protein n=1 Tax=Hymenobacter fodinae TaxID=2510796 RepID=A0A4Z0PCV4_9BACT|nr:hypothetical protein [Hymenobacter fodinae]TGE10302.1 hypothetical protein EU556_05645 [Hymenobacter fodinae]
MKRILCLLLLAGSINSALGQSAKKQKVFTEDIDRFWVAYDSIRTTANRTKQLAYINNLYIKPGTEGLAAFMKARDYSAELWVDLINKLPKYWASIRPNTLAVKTKTKDIEKSIRRFKRLYPEMREASMYFTIGGLRSGGTVDGSKVLIGTEIATGNAQTDVSEFKNPWLPGVFKEQSMDNIVPLNVHEYVHTQQHEGGANLLGQSLKEGACDFVTELIMGKPLQGTYFTYGAAHEQELREAFKQEMFTTYYAHWLYNGSTASTTADLGYYMGYAINKAYYAPAKSKRQAVKEIIELDYANPEAVERFVKQSGYYPEGWDKAALLAGFTARQPVVLGTLPATNGTAELDATDRTLVIQFDREMGEGMSFSPGPRGKEYFPLKKPVGFSTDHKSFTVEMELQPHHEYEFVVTVMPRGFISKDGYLLRQDYPIRFKTK